METAPEHVPERDPEDDAEARSWVAYMTALVEQGELGDDGPYLQQKVEEETRKLKRLELQ